MVYLLLNTDVKLHNKSDQNRFWSLCIIFPLKLCLTFWGQFTGGQQQRCAIARALIKNPKLLLCDEPTGALDSKTSRDILILLEEINRKYGTTMLIVTHNNAIKNMVHKVIIVKDGLIKKDYENEVRTPAAELEDL